MQLAWLAGIADAAYQALFNPVPPERRDQMRAFMEGVPGQAGIALAGLLLLVGDRVFEPRQVAVAGVVIAAATTAVIWRARGAYRDALIAALRIGMPPRRSGCPAKKRMRGLALVGKTYNELEETNLSCIRFVARLSLPGTIAAIFGRIRPGY